MQAIIVSALIAVFFATVNVVVAWLMSRRIAKKIAKQQVDDYCYSMMDDNSASISEWSTPSNGSAD